jgi:hypothetical protein
MSSARGLRRSACFDRFRQSAALHALVARAPAVVVTLARPDTEGVAGRSAFDEVADELYGLPLTEFTAARAAAVAKAKQDGDPELARRIGGLGKPAVVGWLANRLARDHPDQVRSLVELGESLREATRRLDGEQLRTSAPRQQQVVSALVQQARSIADAAGQGMSDATGRSLEQTLHAALVDPQAAAELVAGRLTGALSRSGFPDLDMAERAAAAPSRRTRKEADTAARDAVKQARAEADRTAQAHVRAQQAAEQIEQAVRAAGEHVERLRGQLDEALDEQAKAQQELRTAGRQAREAERAAGQAARRLADALARRQR